jgi:hypothetical protein
MEENHWLAKIRAADPLFAMAVYLTSTHYSARPKTRAQIGKS